MKIRISKTQRWLIIGLAIVIALILIEQIDEDGLDQAPWLIGSLIIGGLLFFAFSPASIEETATRTRPNSKTTSPSQNQALSKLANAIPKIDERFGPVERLYELTYKEWANFFSSSVVDRMQKLSRSDMDHMRKFSEMAAISMSFANFMFFIQGERSKEDSDERKIDAQVLRILATKRLSQQIKFTLDTGPGVLTAEQTSGEVLRSMAMKKLEAHELALNESMRRYVKGEAYPFDPLFAGIDKDAGFELGDPAAREDFFGIKFREELGRFVRESD